VVGSGYTSAFRAARIRDALASRRDWTAADVAALQNDTVDEVLLGPTAAALERALAAARPAGDEAGAPDTLAVIRRILGGWTRRADSTSVAHAFLRRTRTELHRALTDPLVAPVRAAHPSISYDWPLVDEVVRRLLEERPSHLLDPAFESYDAAVLAAARRALAWLEARDEARAAEATPWGAINRARYHHPFGAIVKPLGRWLNMPDVALAGGGGVVRVAGPRAGASLRMVVDLGEPAAASFALPGGQSGHFLSPHYSDSFDEWVAGRTQPLEPGPAVGRIRLEPRTAR
jgi:penicillin amidase